MRTTSGSSAASPAALVPIHPLQIMADVTPGDEVFPENRIISNSFSDPGEFNMAHATVVAATS
jgi:hypothetical protein